MTCSYGSYKIKEWKREKTAMKQKNEWASKLGFIMATAGAAIGLGNCGNSRI